MHIQDGYVLLSVMDEHIFLIDIFQHHIAAHLILSSATELFTKISSTRMFACVCSL